MLGTTNLRQRRYSAGFTLVEIMIALAILGVGMAMVAAVFPAAMRFNEASHNSTLGTIICENGFVLGQLQIKRKDVDDAPTPTLLGVYADGKETDLISARDQHYPTGSDASRTGFALLARRLLGSDHNYQFVTVAYRKQTGENKVKLQELTCIVDGKDVSSANGRLRVGSPLIDRSTGKYAFLESVTSNGNAGVLDRELKDSPESIYAYVLIEAEPDGDVFGLDERRRSPSIGVMAKLTGLDEDHD